MKKLVLVLATSALLVPAAFAQEAPAGESPAEVLPTISQPPPVIEQDKHAFGVLPNYRTVENDLPFAKISAGQKFRIATADTIDGPSFFLAATFSLISQGTGSNPSFGQGTKGYLHRYVTGLADQDIGNYMTEAVMPTLLHQDPRYFRLGHGSTWGRIGYAASRTLLARTDSGHWTFNAAEFLGNGVTASIGNWYYPDERGAGPTMQRMFTQIGTDAFSQVLKEFWPDVKRKYFSKSARREASLASAQN